MTDGDNNDDNDDEDDDDQTIVNPKQSHEVVESNHRTTNFENVLERVMSE